MFPKALEPYLLKVQKPGRYVGGELNSVVKQSKDVDVRFAFCFPDTETGNDLLPNCCLKSHIAFKKPTSALERPQNG